MRGHIAATHGWFSSIHQVAPVCTPSNTLHRSPHPKLHLDQFSHLCTAHSIYLTYYTWHWTVAFPPQIATLHGGIWTHRIHGSLGPLKSTTQTASWWFSRFCMAYDCDGQTDRRTDRPHCSVVTIGHICVVLRCSQIIVIFGMWELWCVSLFIWNVLFAAACGIYLKWLIISNFEITR